MKNTAKQTTMQSIQSQVTESMKQSFVECRQNHTKDEILSHLSSFSSRKTKKAWLTKRINDRVVYLTLLKQASTEGWKHFYGQPIHQKFVELQMATLQSMIEIRAKLSPESERETLVESFLRPLTNSQSKIVSKQSPKPQPKVVEQPKVVAKKVQPKAVKSQPKVESKPSVTDEVILTKIVNNLSELASQVTKLTELCLNNSKAIVELQQSKIVKEQPKVETKKVQPKVAKTQPKVEKVAVEQPKVVTKPKAKKQPKVETTQISLLDAFFKSKPAKVEKKSTISHQDAFQHRSDVEKSTWKKFWMEVK